MAVHVRLRRIGKRVKGKMHFRISAFDQRRPRDGKCIEELGFYNPISKELKIKLERIEYWVKNGAVLSTTVRNLIKKNRASQKCRP
ncbi:MAG: 30S ribosomal protein S16 [Candidatus Omnitrophica bacterium]|nr:30S ribosomal protein S16 [Candidatus Omnitrophota bacterium]